MADIVTPTPITGRTRIMFILADPVAHVRGTALFNAHFQQRGLDAAVSPLHVRPADLGVVVAAIRRMENVAGFGVTIPHKIEVLKHIDSCSARAERVGAANFVRRESDGALAGDNVDGIGFVAGLARNGFDVAGKKVLQIGAGGAGRAIAFALAEAGAAEIAIANRSAQKARLLAEAVQAAVPSCRCRVSPPEASGVELVVNATSLGMHDGDPLPADLSRLASGAVVADVVMTPETTSLLAQAAERGCRIVRGREMLMDQLRLATAFLKISTD
jgi:shikimate dehydrogenase